MTYFDPRIKLRGPLVLSYVLDNRKSPKNVREHPIPFLTYFPASPLHFFIAHDNSVDLAFIKDFMAD